MVLCQFKFYNIERIISLLIEIEICNQNIKIYHLKIGIYHNAEIEWNELINYLKSINLINIFDRDKMPC